MSANIPETKLVSELLKPTGFNCPEQWQGKTVGEILASNNSSNDNDDEDNN